MLRTHDQPFLLNLTKRTSDGGKKVTLMSYFFILRNSIQVHPSIHPSIHYAGLGQVHCLSSMGI
ncbi:hypothetical protein I7I48_06739 [Histoplasma ohiense]|nr:hypothetical protein I7I48_06739 [Histoplasma ohiense (nom. inval.)]